MHKPIHFAIALLLSTAMGAQQFQHAVGSPQTDMLLTLDRAQNSGFLMGGFTNGTSLPGTNGLLIKTDEAGTPEWSKIIGGQGMDNVTRIKTVEDNGYLIGGTSNSGVGNGLPNAFVGRITQEGTSLGFVSIGTAGEEQLRDMQPTADGGLLITGITRFVDNNYDVFVARLDEAANLIWSHVFGSPDYEVPLSITEANDGSIFVWGHQNGAGSQNYDGLLIKLNPSGELLWSRRFGLPNNEIVWDMVETEEGDLILTGDTNSTENGFNDIFLLRVTNEGDVVWSFTYGGLSNEHATNIVKITNQTYAVVGASASFGSGGLDFMAMFIDAGSGGMKYTNAYGGSLKDVAHAAIKTNDSGLLMVGETRSFGPGLMNGLVIRVNQDGQCACNSEHVFPFEVNQIGFTINDGVVDLKYSGLNAFTNNALGVFDGQPSVEVICNDQPSAVEGLTQELAFTQNLEHDQPSNRLILSPNPSLGHPVKLTLEGEGDRQVIIDIYNLEEKRVAGDVVSGYQRIETFLPDLPRGIYLVRTTVNGETETKRLLIE